MPVFIYMSIKFFVYCRWLGIRLETVGNFIIFFAALFSVLNHDSVDAGNAGVSINYALQVLFQNMDIIIYVYVKITGF